MTHSVRLAASAFKFDSSPISKLAEHEDATDFQVPNLMGVKSKLQEEALGDREGLLSWLWKHGGCLLVAHLIAQAASVPAASGKGSPLGKDPLAGRNTKL